MAFPHTRRFRDDLQARLQAFKHGPDLKQTASLKHAAVTIAIVAAEQTTGDAAFLLTRRAKGLRAHGGQWALPGGRCDPGETAVDAALRELHEELGLRLSADAVLGTLDDYATRSGYRITPVVAWAQTSALTPNAAEVASVHRIPLADLAHPDAVSFVTIAESERRVVRLRTGGDLIHAPTAAMLYQFGELLCGRHTRVADLEQPVFAWR